MNQVPKRLLQGGALVLAALLVIPAHADDKADALLKEVTAAAQAAKAMTADVTISTTVAGQNTHAEGKVRLKKPNLLRIVMTGSPDVPQTIASDGKNVWTLMPGNQYMKTPADSQGDSIQEAIRPMFGEAPLFFSSKSLNPFAEVGKSAPPRYAGKETLAGKEYDVVELAGSGQIIYSIKYYINAQKLIERAILNITQGQQSIKFTSSLNNIVLNPTLADAEFAYAPPKTAKLFEQPQEPDFNAKLIPVGKEAPKFSFPDLKGGHLALDAALKGKKAVLVNFWFVGCPACREEFPHLQKLYAELKDKGFELVAINVQDEKQAIRQYVTEGKFTFPIGIGANDPLIEKYGIEACPTNYILDSSGKIVWRSVGFDEAGLRAALAKLNVK